MKDDEDEEGGEDDDGDKDDEDDGEDDDDEDELSDMEDDGTHKEDRIKDLNLKEKKKKKENSFFEEAPETEQVDNFELLNLSRPLVKAIGEMGWKTPTPIQQQVIPIALAGRDIAGSATTGSGKTASFVLPVLERLMFRDMRVPVTRVLILTPTRELGAQCHSVISNLSKYMKDIRVSLVLGGLSLQQQSVELRSRPDIIVATPGRLIDHLLNTQSFGLDDLEILILDEADRLLELGFAQEIEQIIKLCPKGRQSMLFSATMTDKVSELMKLSLHRPVRLNLDPLFQTSKKLLQEFVKIRKAQEDHREAYLLALCSRTFKNRTIIFVNEKTLAHKIKVIFGLAGLSAAELHGNLTQLQRLDALESFRDGKVDFLIATDLASRGLDILGIQTVINYNMPKTEAIYVHRVGRTARAGKNGRAISFVGDSMSERKLLKDVVKHSSANSCKHRVIPTEAIQQAASKIESLDEEIKEVFDLEKQEKLMQKANMEMDKVENMIKHADEIKARPARGWFMSGTEKQRIKDEKTRLNTDDGEDGGGEEGDKKVVDDAPNLKLPFRKQTTRKERKRKESKGDAPTQSQYQLAKKRNKKIAGLKRKNSSSSGQPPAKKQKTDKPEKKLVRKRSTSSLEGKSSSKKSNKSSKKYKRRK
eukprot:TRINITY_DN4686_c0_g1_i1.p1 TRINITY_DN4686_c0_g1~~TRINITY_DN4686_c0_g1_i1.p1  ORF type:complete len:755 (-),score=258.39 TRINITY_DN4686_c0_g1_i1:247-2187(-)